MKPSALLRFMMKRFACVFLCVVLSATAGQGANSGEELRPPAPIDLSFANEIQNAIDRGLASLLRSQNSNGWWWEKDPNLVTAYAIQSLDIIHRGIR